MIAAIIQARVGSTRLPGKIFAKICGKPFIQHVVARLRACKSLDAIYLATTTNPADDALEAWGKGNRLEVFRGSESDVLARFHGCAEKFKVKTIVRITADDPFKDPEVVDAVVKFYQQEKLDFAYNNKPPSFPEGLDVEVFSFDALNQAHRHAAESFEREHVTPYLYRHPESFRQKNYTNKEDISFLRWTVDAKEDLEMARKIYRMLYPKRKIFGMHDILKLLEKKPALAEMNRTVKRSAMYAKTK